MQLNEIKNDSILNGVVINPPAENPIGDLERAIHGYFDGTFTEHELLSVNHNALDYLINYCFSLAQSNRSMLMIVPFNSIKVGNFSSASGSNISLGFGVFDRVTAKEICEEESNPIRKYALCIYKYLVHLRMKIGIEGYEVSFLNLLNLGYSDPLLVTDILDFYTDVVSNINDDRDFSSRTDKTPPDFMIKNESQKRQYLITKDGVVAHQIKTFITKDDLEHYKEVNPDWESDKHKYNVVMHYEKLLEEQNKAV